MKSRIIIHATNTPSDMPLTLDDIMSLNSEDRYSDPMPYHYIVNIDGRILKGKRDNELCGHCGKFSRDSLSVAYVGGLLPETNEQYNTLNPQQESALRILIRNLIARHPTATITGANSLLHPDDDPTYNEPYFNVPQWWFCPASPDNGGFLPASPDNGGFLPASPDVTDAPDKPTCRDGAWISKSAVGAT